MSATQVIIHLFGDIALLLWGIHMVHSGVMRAFGSELRRVLGAGLKSRPSAFAAGVGVTAVLQSSTATALMATSFAAEGVVSLVPALALMLGANVGTTLIVQAFSFDIGLVYPVLILAGVTAFRRGGRTLTRDLGRVGIGLGLMLLSLHLLTEAISPIETAPAVRDLLAALTREPVLNLAIAAIITWAAHSSVAIVLFVMSLAAAGVLSPSAALAMVLGANLGSALNPVLEGTGGDPLRLRLPLGNLVNRAVGCAIALPLLPWIVSWLAVLDASPARMAALFHMAFNIVLALAAMPLLGPFARLLTKLLPQKIQANDPGTPQYLDASALETPSVALSNAARESLRMADVVEAMLRGSQDLIHSGDRKRVAEIGRLDDIVDRLHGEIERYLTAISREASSDAETRRLADILGFTINLEHIGDIVDKNLKELGAKCIKNRLKLSPEGLAEIDGMHQRLIDHMQLAIAVYMSGDINAARRLVAEKEQFRELERIATERHFERVRDGDTASIETSAIQLDIVRDLKRIEAHIASAAYPLLEQSGVLRQSRLK
ncbi:Na/Pi cotransporter [Alsobacter soli]|uniref:Na/Pi cotransporter n=1 Tax=Alsobacter soli TaxID=2109933 RepID=A0A2T1HTK7_9HYPH|nr:Na/Pi cotransporter family protein [Alsobacter soli]PSC04964.1 Na/Pi cotransporter [Alsobacter soli]